MEAWLKVAVRHKNRHSDQWNRIENPEMDPQTYGQLIFEKTGKNIQWNKDSLLSKCAGKTGQWYAEWAWTTFSHKKTLKTDVRPKCKIGSHQNPQGESRQKPLWSCPQQLLTQHVSRGKGNKSKNELLWSHQNKKLLHSEGHNQQN